MPQNEKVFNVNNVLEKGETAELWSCLPSGSDYVEVKAMLFLDILNYLNIYTYEHNSQDTGLCTLYMGVGIKNQKVRPKGVYMCGIDL